MISSSLNEKTVGRILNDSNSNAHPRPTRNLSSSTDGIYNAMNLQEEGGQNKYGRIEFLMYLCCLLV